MHREGHKIEHRIEGEGVIKLPTTLIGGLQYRKYILGADLGTPPPLRKLPPLSIGTIIIIINNNKDNV